MTIVWIIIFWSENQKIVDYIMIQSRMDYLFKKKNKKKKSKSRKHSRIAFYFHYSLKVVHIKESYFLYNEVLWNYNPTIIVHFWSVFLLWHNWKFACTRVQKHKIFIEKDVDSYKLVLSTKNYKLNHCNDKERNVVNCLNGHLKLQ